MLRGHESNQVHIDEETEASIQQFETEVADLYRSLMTWTLSFVDEDKFTPGEREVITKRAISTTPLLSSPELLSDYAKYLKKNESSVWLDTVLELKQMCETFMQAPHGDIAARKLRKRAAYEAMENITWMRCIQDGDKKIDHQKRIAQLAETQTHSTTEDKSAGKLMKANYDASSKVQHTLNLVSDIPSNQLYKAIVPHFNHGTLQPSMLQNVFTVNIAVFVANELSSGFVKDTCDAPRAAVYANIDEVVRAVQVCGPALSSIARPSPPRTRTPDKSGSTHSIMSRVLPHHRHQQEEEKEQLSRALIIKWQGKLVNLRSTLTQKNASDIQNELSNLCKQIQAVAAHTAQNSVETTIARAALALMSAIEPFIAKATPLKTAKDHPSSHDPLTALIQTQSSLSSSATSTATAGSHSSQAGTPPKVPTQHNKKRPGISINVNSSIVSRDSHGGSRSGSGRDSAKAGKDSPKSAASSTPSKKAATTIQPSTPLGDRSQASSLSTIDEASGGMRRSKSQSNFSILTAMTAAPTDDASHLAPPTPTTPSEHTEEKTIAGTLKFDIDTFEKEMGQLFDQLKGVFLPLTYLQGVPTPDIATPILFAAPSIIDPVLAFLTNQFCAEGLQAGLQLKHVWETFTQAPHATEKARLDRMLATKEQLKEVGAYCLAELNIENSKGEAAKTQFLAAMENPTPSMFKNIVNKHIYQLLEDDAINRFKDKQKAELKEHYSDYLLLIKVDSEIQSVLTAIQKYRAVHEAESHKIHATTTPHKKEGRLARALEHFKRGTDHIKGLAEELTLLQLTLSLKTREHTETQLQALRKKYNKKLAQVEAYTEEEQQALKAVRIALSPVAAAIRESKQLTKQDLPPSQEETKATDTTGSHLSTASSSSHSSVTTNKPDAKKPQPRRSSASEHPGFLTRSMKRSDSSGNISSLISDTLGVKPTASPPITSRRKK